MNDRPGRAVFLVGPSSAGKSSLGEALLDAFREPFMFFETDRYGLSGPGNRPDLVTPVREEMIIRGAAYAVRGYLDAAIDLIVERSFWHVSARAMAATVFAPYDAWLVGLRWELEELERRERGRTDGIFPGTARAQATGAGEWDLPYDFVVDTVALSPEAAARVVAAWVAGNPEPTAIRDIAGTWR